MSQKASELFDQDISEERIETIEEPTSNPEKHENSIEEEEQDSGWNFDVWVNLLAMYWTYFSTVWTLYIPSASLGFLEEAFPNNVGILPWVAAVPGLCQCALSLFVGELSDIFGRRWFLIFANAFCLVGNLVVSRANNATVLIGGQVLNGCGIALGFLTTPLLAECVPKRSRSIVLAVGTALLGITTSGGGIAQGAFVKSNVGGVLQGWRIGIYMGAGFAFIGLVLIICFYHPGRRPNPEGLTTKQKLLNIDWTGIMVGCSGVTLVLVGLQYGGNPYPWDSVRVLTFIITGFGLLAAFATWEAYFVKFGLFPKVLFQHRNFAVVLVVQFLEGIIINSTTAFLTQIQLTTFRSSALMALVRGLPFGGATIVGSAITGWVLYSTKEARWVLLGALSIGVLSSGLMSILQPSMNYAGVFFATALLGLTVAGLGITVLVVASLCVPNQFIATSISLLNSIRGLGSSIGIVVFSQIFNSKIKKNIPLQVAGEAVAAGLPAQNVGQLLLAYYSGNVSQIENVPGVTAAVLEVIPKAIAQAYANSWRYIWYGLFPFLVVSMVVTLLLTSTKDQMTQEITSHVQRRHRLLQDEKDC